MRERDEVHALIGLIALFAVTAAWWALALWPVSAGPEWLERTRYVCFGVASNGLPDAGGWIGLTAGPLGMLAILVVGWRSGMYALVQRARRSRVTAAVLGSLVIGCMVMVTGAGVRVQQARTALQATDADTGALPDSYPRLDRPAPPLRLTSQHGASLDIASLRGQPVLVTFAYAHCETVCPVVVRHSLDAQADLRAAGRDVAVLIVTLDPWRDTPSRFPSMAGSWGLPEDGAWILGGAVTDVESALDAWQVPRSRDTSTGEVTHPSLVYVVDGEGQLAYAVNGGRKAIVSLVQRL